MTIEICQLRPEAALFEAVARLRYQVYAIEERQALPGMDHARGRLEDALDAHASVFAAIDSGCVVGTIRTVPLPELPSDDPIHEHFSAVHDLVPEERQVAVGRLMVDRRHRGGPACQLLLAAAYRHALDMGFEIGFSDCSPRNVALYESLGCRQAKRPFFDPHYGLNVLLAFVLRDFNAMRRSQSPLLAHTAGWAPNEDLAIRFAALTGSSTEPLSLRLKSPDMQTALLRELLAPSDSAFANLSGPDLSRLTKSAAVFELESGARLLLPGSACTETFFVIDGEVELLVPRPSTEAPTRQALTAGQVFNEQSLLAGSQQPVRICATTTAPTRLLAMSAESFGALRVARPDLARAFEERLSRLAACRDHDARPAFALTCGRVSTQPPMPGFADPSSASMQGG